MTDTETKSDPIASLELTVDQAAQLTAEHGGTEQRIRQLAKDGKIPFKQDKPRAAIRIMHHDLDMVRKALTEMVKRGPAAVKVTAEVLSRIEALEAAVFGADKAEAPPVAVQPEPVTPEAAVEPSVPGVSAADDDLPF